MKKLDGIKDSKLGWQGNGYYWIYKDKEVQNRDYLFPYTKKYMKIRKKVFIKSEVQFERFVKQL